MRQLPRTRRRDPNLLVGNDTADDAGVYRLDAHRALVQTTDFFTPVVDDPFAFGQIAAANALSDVYAMGGRPLTALNLLGIPDEVVTAEVIAQILRGGAAKTREAGCTLVGGHTVRSPEPLYGLSVTGLVHPKRLLTNAAARPGDLLVLTKPLGTGIVTTAIKRGECSIWLKRKTIALMSRLNRPGAELGERGLLRAATDVTGFGLLGHLASMCRASSVSAEIYSMHVPAIGKEVFSLIEKGCIPSGSLGNLDTAHEIMDVASGVSEARLSLLTDAQTSGGLLLCVPPRRLAAVFEVLKAYRTPCATVVGKIVRATQPLIRVIV